MATNGPCGGCDANENRFLKTCDIAEMVPESLGGEQPYCDDWPVVGQPLMRLSWQVAG